MTTATLADCYILFLIAGTTYAVRSEDVRHIEMIEHITPVPNATPYLEGVVFSRGHVVPVLSLRARFGFERIPLDPRTRLLIVQSGERQVGLAVDSAREFIRLPRESIQAPGAAMTGLSADYLDGVASLHDRLVLVLNVGAVIDSASVPNGASGGDLVNAGRGGAVWNTESDQESHHGSTTRS